MTKEYVFALTIDEARAIVIALKKLPMEQVEAIVTKLDTQFSIQAQQEQQSVSNNQNTVATEASNSNVVETVSAVKRKTRNKKNQAA